MTSSRESKLTKSPMLQWNDSVISSTYHDVQIKQVQIVEKKNIVKFDESKITDQQSEASGRHSRVKLFAPPPSEEGELGNEEQPEEKNVNWINIRRQSAVSFEVDDRKNEVETHQQQHPHSSVPVITVPIEPVGIAMPKTAPISKPISRQIDRTIREKRRMKLSQQRGTNKSRSPLDRRLSSGIRRAKLYEVSPGVFVPELPPNVPQTAPESGMSPDVYYQDIKVPYTAVERAKTTLPHATRSVIWTSKNRFGSSRAVSSLSSAKWKLQQEAMSDPMKRVNMFVKMPFKQTPCITMNRNVELQGDDVVQANDDLRLATAFTVSRVRRAIQQMESPANANKAQGRLLKGRLQPLRPVKNNGPTVNDCCGIQPENKKVRSYSPSPSRQRQLKQELQMAILDHRSKVEEELERRMQVHSTISHESVHMTSPEPPHMGENADLFYLNEGTNLYITDKISESSYENKITSQVGSMTLESAVIY